MRKSTIEAEYQAAVNRVWDIVTNNQDYAWRSDLAKIEVTGENEFTEYTKAGYQTNFKITLKQEYERYEFDMENKNFQGHWVGEFSETESGGTKIIFTEELQIKNPLMEVLSYIFMPLKKIQKTYAEDLRKALGEAV